jgi:hypothetical protein
MFPGHVDRWRQKMAQTIELEKVDEHGEPEKRFKALRAPAKPRQVKKPRIEVQGMVESSDPEDEDYEEQNTAPSESSAEDALADELSNAEVSNLSLG